MKQQIENLEEELIDMQSKCHSVYKVGFGVKNVIFKVFSKNHFKVFLSFFVFLISIFFTLLGNRL